MTSVGVTIPTLGDRPELLHAAVKSVLGQTPPPAVNVVVPVDRMSGAARLLGEFDVGLVPQRKLGISAAINEGWRRHGDVEFVGWLGDDDLLYAGSVQTVAEALARRPDASGAVGRCDVIDEDGRRLYTMAGGSMALWLQRFGHNLVMQPGALFRREAVADAGMLDESLRYVMDYDLMLRLRRWGPIVSVPRTLAAFRWHQGSTTVANQNASYQECAMVRRRYWRGVWWEPLAEDMALVLSKPVYWLAKRRVR